MPDATGKLEAVKPGARVRWLHLTDFHQGQKDQPRKWDQVKACFLEDLRHHAAKLGGIDAIFFTGDLAYSGQAAQYVAVQRGLDEISDLLAEYGPRPKLLAVPGNHDVLLPKDDAIPDAVWALQQWRNNEALRTAFWKEKPKSGARKYVEKVLKPYCAWWTVAGAAVNPHVDANSLPGEFSATLEIDGIRFGVAGLNTTFLQLWKGVKAGGLDLDGEQLYRALGGPPSEWLGKHHLSVLLTHQPPTWLSSEGQSRYRSEVYPPGAFAVHFCGHLHESVGTSEHWLGSGPRRMIQGPSLYGEDRWVEDGKPVTQRVHGYTVGQFLRQDNGWLLEFWPRTLEPTGSGGYSPGPDRRYKIGHDGEVREAIPDPEARPHTAAPPRADTKVEAFLDEYRKKLEDLHARWDRSTAWVPDAISDKRPEEVRLDDMYFELRVAEGYVPDELERGAPLLASDLLALAQPVVLRGAAGSGKTTWMRYTFRRLLRLPEALPVPVELRALAKDWAGRKRDEQSLEKYLHDWAEAEGCPGCGPILMGLLKNPPAHLTPVLLVDGWDELGHLGEQLRRQLVGMMRIHPSLKVVVSSRPYGEGKPSHAEGFRTLDLQPLNDGEIARFAERFHRLCYQEDATALTLALRRFNDALEGSREARALARTPLLLTMLLFLARVRTLPDSRHDLYAAVIDNLLNAIPRQHDTSGVLLSDRQWRPEQHDERLQAVSRLAFEAQSRRKPWESVAVAVTREEFVKLLPEGGTRDNGPYFLNWLVERTGILTDRSDGTLQFAHLSFQEFLAARHLHARADGTEARLELFQRYAQEDQWWETLRLAAALIQARYREHSDTLVSQLTAGEPRHYWLAGAILADGISGDEVFEAWYKSTIERLGNARELSTCRFAWRSCRQFERRERLSASICARSENLRWTHWYRVREWLRGANMEKSEFALLQGNGAILLRTATEPIYHGSRETAVGRVLAGAYALWPKDAAGLGLLNLWPGRRRIAGLRLQSLASLGGDRLALSALAHHARPVQTDTKRWLDQRSNNVFSSHTPNCQRQNKNPQIAGVKFPTSPGSLGFQRRAQPVPRPVVGRQRLQHRQVIGRGIELLLQGWVRPCRVQGRVDQLPGRLRDGGLPLPVRPLSGRRIFPHAGPPPFPVLRRNRVGRFVT